MSKAAPILSPGDLETTSRKTAIPVTTLRVMESQNSMHNFIILPICIMYNKLTFISNSTVLVIFFVTKHMEERIQREVNQL